MKFVVVDPGADWATADVYDGLVTGLRAHGHEVLEYRLGRRLSLMSYALLRAWRQKQKAGERVTRPTDADSAALAGELAVTWALRHEPDWFLVVSGMYFHPDCLIIAKRAGLRTGIVLTESPYSIVPEATSAGLVDACWTNERTAVEPLRTVQPHTYYLPHGWHPQRHRPGEPVPDGLPAHDVLFVGTGFIERVRLLESVDWTGIDLAVYGTWRLASPRSPVRDAFREKILANATATGLYRKAAIDLNLFRTSMKYGKTVDHITGSESLGPRAYELAASVCFFVSEPRPELTERLGDVVPTFASGAELQDLVRRWLSDAPGRAERAAALPAMMRGHTWVERAGQIVADLARVAQSAPPAECAVPTAAAIAS